MKSVTAAGETANDVAINSESPDPKSNYKSRLCDYSDAELAQLCDYYRDTSVRKIMATAYAIALVILSLGFVILTVCVCYLAFQYPEKAGSFVTLFVTPLLALLAAYAIKARNGAMKYSDSTDILKPPLPPQ
jgi:hypothetical protein